MSNKFFSEIKKKVGFNYFDAVHGYVSGKSETALKDCLTSRYTRSAIFQL